MRLVAPDLGEVRPVMRACIHALELLFVASLAGFLADELRVDGSVVASHVALCHMIFRHSVRAAALHGGHHEQCNQPDCDPAR
jgi:hypothetical protein